MSENEQMQRQRELADYFRRSALRRTLGLTLSYAEDGTAVFSLEHNSDFEHALGDTHGGVIATLLDYAGWFAVAQQYDVWVATVEMQVRILEPARQEDLRATGRVIRAGKRLAVAEMEVRSASDRLVAVGSGTFSVTSISRH